MLVIRPDQMELMGAERFIERIFAYIQEAFPEAQEVHFEELRDTLWDLMVRAQGYSLTTEQEIATFIVTAWVMGEDFDTAFEAPQEILPSDEYTPTEKAEWLEEWTRTIFNLLECEE